METGVFSGRMGRLKGGGPSVRDSLRRDLRALSGFESGIGLGEAL